MINGSLRSRHVVSRPSRHRPQLAEQVLNRVVAPREVDLRGLDDEQGRGGVVEEEVVVGLVQLSEELVVRHEQLFGCATLAIAQPLVLKTAAQGAATQCYLATSPAVATITGAYFRDCNPAEPRPFARDDAMAARLWATSEEIAAKVA